MTHSPVLINDSEIYGLIQQANSQSFTGPNDFADVEHIYQYRAPTQQENNQHTTQHQFEGGWCYQRISSAEKETVDYIQEEFREVITKSPDLSRISFKLGFIPMHTFNEIFPPTRTLPLGWNRYTTRCANEIITIKHNFSELNFLFGVGIEEFCRGEFQYRLKKQLGVKITRTNRRKTMIITLGYSKYVKSSNCLLY
jgi:hypothetical protein